MRGPTRPLFPHCPLPTASPSDLLLHTLNSLCHNDDPQPDTGLATLHAACAPNATINGEPIPPDPADFLNELDDYIRDTLTNHVQLFRRDPETPDDNTYIETATIIQRGGPTHHATFHLHGGAALRAASDNGTAIRTSPERELGASENGGAVSNGGAGVPPSAQCLMPSALPWRIHTLEVKPINPGFR